MVQLTIKEVEWLQKNYPNLIYDESKGLITGVVEFNLCYQDRPTIHDKYKIKIDMSSMGNRMELPKVYNSNGRIKGIAERKGISTFDLHLNSDNSLCLIYPLKIKRYYPNGFSLEEFMQHLENHLYWISHVERYNQEPWKGEQHDYRAFIDYLLDYNNIDDILNNSEMLQCIRYIYKCSFNKGIALNKLRNRLKDPFFLKTLREKANEKGFIR